ncbi:hypothetical protein [Hyphomonas sp.]|uniref:hypothetical protein n=1 Tax=Hyphomonas sp. TaxID=87 RepID=UPI00391A6570
MSFAGGSPGFKAIQALVAAQEGRLSVADKDWAAAAGLIVKKLLVSGGQTTDSLNALRAAVGDEIFDAQLKTLSHHQAKLLARRLDKSVPDLEISTARAAIAWIRTALAPIAPPTDEPAEEETATEETVPETAEDNGTDETPPTSPNPYFGRKSFRTG